MAHLAIRMLISKRNLCNYADDKTLCTRFFFISNLGFCLELGLLNSETKIGTGVA